MNKLLISLFLFFLSLILLVCAPLVGSHRFTNDTNSVSCLARNSKNPVVNEKCFEWYDNTCWEGKYTNTQGSCVHKRNTLSFIFLILAGISFFTCLVFLGMGLIRKKKRKHGHSKR